MKTYPNHTLEKALRERGVPCKVLWEQKGPRGTNIAWMVGYAVNGCVVIVQTFHDGNGWEAYTPLTISIQVEDTITDVLQRCNAA